MPRDRGPRHLDARVKPSGYVHYVVGISTGGTRWLACGEDA